MNLLEQLGRADLDALIMLVQALQTAIASAATNAENALEVNLSAIVGEGTGNNQSINYPTLFGNTTDTSVPVRSLSFLIGAKGFLGYVNDATGAMYIDTDVSQDPNGLGQYEVVNYRTLIRMINAVTQPTDVGWESDVLTFGLDSVNNGGALLNVSQYKSQLFATGIYTTKIIGLTKPVKNNKSDPIFSKLYTTTQMANIPNFDSQMTMPKPYEYGLYLETLYNGNIARIPLNNINFMVYTDSDGDLSIMINSDGLVSVPWQNTPISIVGATLFLVIDSWTY